MPRENRSLTSLRGLAALWVVLDHLDQGWDFPLPPGGHAALLLGGSAVDIFFVLSGFIMAGVHGDLRMRGVGDFFRRRVFRIYPLHLAIMAALGASALIAEMRGAGMPDHHWASFWTVSALAQVFADGNPAWNPPSWSASVEIICYVLFPPCIAVLRKAGPKQLALGVLALGIAEYFVVREHGGATIGIGAALRGVAGFSLGMVLSGWWRTVRPTIGEGARAASLIAFLVSVAVNSPEAVAVAAAALIVCLADDAGRLARALGHGWFVWIGRVSFSIYLLHIPWLVQFDRIPWVKSALPTQAYRLPAAVAFIASLLLLSGLAHVLIERPARRLARRTGTRISGTLPQS